MSRRCFATDGRRLVMPAFGAYAGGLNVRDRAIFGLFGTLAFTAHMLGAQRLYAIAATRCCRTDRRALANESVSPKHYACDPAGQQRHQRGRKSVEQAVVARGIDHELLEADLDDLEGESVCANRLPSANSLTSTL